jgi:pimeloyl-ACP methyl ester carboxylesterase
VQKVVVGPSPRIALSVAGEGDTVFFLHGIGGNRHSWDAQVECFSRRYRAVAWDARGYGDSEDYEGPLEFAVFTRDIVRVLDHLGAGRIHLVGLSMGGRIARNFALAHPERLKSLVLANTSPGFGALSESQVAAFVEQRRKLDPVAQAKRLLGPSAPLAAFERLTSALGAVHVESYLKTIEASVVQDLAAPVENIRVPTLVIGGRHDPLYPIEIARGLAARIPGAKLVELDCGHVSNLELPDQFNSTVLEFLQSREKST